MYETLLQKLFYVTFLCNGDVVAMRSSATIKLDQKEYKEKMKYKLHRISNDDVINMWFLKKKECCTNLSTNNIFQKTMALMFSCKFRKLFR